MCIWKGLKEGECGKALKKFMRALGNNYESGIFAVEIFQNHVLMYGAQKFADLVSK